MTQEVIDGAYLERNRLVAFLAHLYPSGIAKTAIEGWDPEWHNCVYIDTPAGQMSWHYHDRDAWLFDCLPPYRGEWDGHTTEQKYNRLHALSIGAFDRGVASVIHASDCALHNEPAFPAGPCDCGAVGGQSLKQIDDSAAAT